MRKRNLQVDSEYLLKYVTFNELPPSENEYFRNQYPVLEIEDSKSKIKIRCGELESPILRYNLATRKYELALAEHLKKQKETLF